MKPSSMSFKSDQSHSLVKEKLSVASLKISSEDNESKTTAGEKNSSAQDASDSSSISEGSDGEDDFGQSNSEDELLDAVISLDHIEKDW